ncbi:MAG: DNA topoisomerase, partial [Armatimonadota bacterium]
VDQMRLYRLIWQRFVASQMNPALYDVETVDINAGRFGFRATGSTEKFKGFRILYTEGTDEVSQEVEDEDRPPLPRLSAKQMLKLLELLPDQHFTEPPPRFTEASLVKLLEEKGIGRPSTYASIVGTIKDRGYVNLEQKRFKPTELGFTVNDLLVKHFPDVLDVSFTASIESRLDDVEDGKLEWVELLKDFYGPFKTALDSASELMESVKVAPQESDEDCPNCGRKMLIRESRFGDKFLGCSGYPECKTTKSLQEPLDVKCPTCGDGDIYERKSRRGKVFYGCNKYPDCSFVSWDKPIAEKCPTCAGVLVDKTTKTRGHEIKCSAEGCTYSRKVEGPAETSEEAA